MRSSPLLSALLCLCLLFGVAPRSEAKSAPFDRFEAKRAGHSWINAYLLALAAGHGQRGKVRALQGETFEEKFSHSFEPLGLEVAKFIDTDTIRSDTQVLVLVNDSVVLVLFGGSESHGIVPIAQDWLLTDAIIKLVPFLDVNVHAGFSRALTAAYPELKTAIDEQLRDGRNLWIAGHSLGGALASLTAYWLEQEGVSVAGVYTYGSPRVGDSTWVDHFGNSLAERAQHWAHSKDPVVMSPPASEKRPYRTMAAVNMIEYGDEILLGEPFEANGVPNPWEHRMAAYANHIYWGMPEADRKDMPAPPPVCGAGDKMVEVHPTTNWPLCKRTVSWKIGHAECEKDGGEIVGEWCAFAMPDRRQHRARKLK
jgi:hypothetical protein